MEKISIKQLLEFKNKSVKSRKTLLSNLEKPKSTVKGSGGNYWVRSISALSKSIKTNENRFITQKIEEILEKQKQTDVHKTIVMYERNVNILTSFENVDLSKFKPKEELNIESILKANSIIKEKGLPIQVIPNVLFTYKKGDANFVGGILLVAKIQKFTRTELYLQCELLYRYLQRNYSLKYKIEDRFCLIIDMLETKSINREEYDEAEISKVLDEILEEISQGLKN